MSKHTPGPWVVYDDSKDGKTNRIEIAARGKTVARIYHSEPEEDLPNACLIAAAPDLLEALQTIANGTEFWDAYPPEHPYGKAKAAMLKARQA